MSGHTQADIKRLAEAAQMMPWDRSETDVPHDARWAFRNAITADAYLELLAQRDELLAVLKLIFDAAPEIDGLTDAELLDGLDAEDDLTQRQVKAFINARAAIAKAEGSKVGDAG